MKQRFLTLIIIAFSTVAWAAQPLRIIVETDAGGDPDDQASLVRFLMYASEWDVEGIIADRPATKNNNAGTGLDLVRQYIDAYGEVRPNLVKHDSRFPTHQHLHDRTVAGYKEVTDGVDLIIASLESADPRPLWYANWGSNSGTLSNMQRALDQLKASRTPEQFARLVSKLRISTLDGDKGTKQKHTADIPLHIETGYPAMEGGRWYHQFRGITESAGGFDVKKDVQTGHGPLGALYTTPKEGDSWTFVYLIPTGMNDPEQPLIGSWAGRYGPRAAGPGDGKVDKIPAPSGYYWANQTDAWNGATSRNNAVARFATAVQNDFKARMDWCVAPTFAEANHPPVPVLDGDKTGEILKVSAAPGSTLKMSASGSSDPDGDTLAFKWWVYPEAGTYAGVVSLTGANAATATLEMPADADAKTIHVILEVTDDGEVPLTRYRRMVVTGATAATKPTQ